MTTNQFTAVDIMADTWDDKVDVMLYTYDYLFRCTLYYLLTLQRLFSPLSLIMSPLHVHILKQRLDEPMIPPSTSS